MSDVKKFSVSSNGYDIEEVNNFLKVVTSEFEKLVNKNSELESTIDFLNAKVTEFEEKNSSIDIYKAEFDEFLDDRTKHKEILESEIKCLELKVEEYNKVLKELFYNQVELIEKLK